MNTVPASRAGGLIGSTDINPRPDVSTEVIPSPAAPRSAAAVLPDPCVVVDEPEVVVPPVVVPVPVPLCQTMPPEVVPVVDPVPEVCDDVDEPDELPPEVAPPEVGEGAGVTTTTGLVSPGVGVGELTTGRSS